MKLTKALSCAIIILTLLGTTLSAQAQTQGNITFKFGGFVEFAFDQTPPDIAVDDEFFGSYTFDPLTPGAPHDPPNTTLDTEYRAVTSWSVTLPGKGITLTGSTGEIAVGNNTPGWFYGDRYIATLFPDTNSAPAPVLSGHRFSYFQIDITDFRQETPADLLQDSSLPLTAPDLRRTQSHNDRHGRFVFHDSSFQNQITSFTTADPDDQKWQAGFVLPPGVDGEVYAVAVMGSDLYVGGRFEKAGDSTVNSIARWDGTNWHRLGTGIRGVVYALAVEGSNVYAGGQFDRAGYWNATNLACWRGVEWQPIGNVAGIDSQTFAYPNFGSQGPKVTALLATNGQLFVGGNFREVGGVLSGMVPATNVARWDGTNWSSLGSGAANRGGHVRALAWLGDSLFAGGIFLNAGDVAATNIASWSGTQWQPVGPGLRGAPFGGFIQDENLAGVVHTLTVVSGDLYAGGTFTHAGDRRIENLARWNGTSWRRVAPRIVSRNSDGGVFALASRGDRLYVAGLFDRLGGRAVTNIAFREHGRWTSPAGGLNAPGTAMALVGDQLYAGGSFGVAGQASAAHIAKWNGEEWSALGSGIGNTVIPHPITITASSNKVIVAGSLHTAGTNRVSNVAAWNGNKWSALGQGLRDGYVISSAWVGKKYYAAGRFTLANGRQAALACWNGSTWRPIATGLHSPIQPASIYTIAAHQGLLYGAGNFHRIGRTAVTNVAVWNGRKWAPVGTNAPQPAPSRSSQQLVSGNGHLYMTAHVRDSENPFGRVHVFDWNGNNWVDLGGVDDSGFVQTLAVFRAQLYAAGRFDSLGGASAHNIARWNGMAWESLGNVIGDNDNITTMAATDNYLYIGGTFTSVAGIPAANIARFDGTNWRSCGSGLVEFDGRASVNFLTTGDGKVYPCGIFKTAGGKPSYRFAVWDE